MSFVVGNNDQRNMIFSVNGTAGYIQSVSNGAAYAPLSFNQNGGNVGIKSDSPYSLFTIKSSYSGGTTGGFCIDANDGAAYRLFLYPYVQGGGQVAYQFNVQNQGTTYTSLILGYNGNVGIGITTPVGKLSVLLDGSGTNNLNDWTSAYALFGPGVGSTTGSCVGITYNTASNYGSIICLAPNVAWRDMNYVANSHTFRYGNTSLMYIDSSSVDAKVNFYSRGETYLSSWLRITNNDTGIYWENLGRGITSTNGSLYGNISTYGTGKNTWSGYDIGTRFTFMANGNTVGIHDTSHSWLWRCESGNCTIDRGLTVTGNVNISGNNGVILNGTSYNTIYITATDGASAGVNTNNLVIQSWYGLGFATYNGYATAFINTRNGYYYGNWGGASDKRIKKNITTSINALNTIDQINVVSYDYIEQSKGNVKYGIIAQDIQSILPEAVTISGNYIGDCDKCVCHIHDNINNIITVTCNNHGYNTNDNLRFTNDNDIHSDNFHTGVITVIDNNTFTILSWKDYDMTKPLYIYGKYIKDFCYVDKTHFGLLAISGIKEQNTIIQKQAAEISALQAIVAVQSTDALQTQVNSQQLQIAQLIRRLAEAGIA